MSTLPRIIAEVPVTYGEMIEVLTKLGYSQEFDGKNNRYVNDRYESVVLLPVRPSDTILEKVYLALYSSHLYQQGVIKEEDNLIQMIQKNRVKKNKKATNSRQVSA
jgi:predicted RNA binding protein YcfA (HicA-like mRNA interferase family)